MFAQLLSRSDHSLCRRFWLTVQFMYQARRPGWRAPAVPAAALHFSRALSRAQVSLLVMNWVAVGSLYLSVVIILNAAFQAIRGSSAGIVFTFQTLYMYLVLLQVLCGLGSRAQDVQRIYFVSSIAFGEPPPYSWLRFENAGAVVSCWIVCLTMLPLGQD